MATLYDKNGKKYNVPHAVDVKGWLATGKFYEDKPKANKKSNSEEPKVEDIDQKKANELYKNIDKLNADDIKLLAKYLKVEYTTKDETVIEIKSMVGK